jgi:hypothetical protein
LGPDFDRRHVQHQLTGHKETVALFDRSKAAIIRN